jgi:hypothetical protein
MQDITNRKYEKDDLYKLLDRTTQWIGNCDSKASIVIGAMGVIIAVVCSSDYIKKIIDIIRYMIQRLDFLAIVFLILTLGSIICGLVGGYHLIRVLIPKIDITLYNEVGIQSNSIIFFGTVSKNISYSNYKMKLKGYSELDWENDIISQTYINSKICKLKFDYYKRGLVLTFVSFVVFVTIMLIGFILM